MDTEELLPYIIVGALIWIFISYQIILNAVISATQGQSRHLKMLFRMKAKQMMKEGATYQNIVDIYGKSDEEFWQELKEDVEKNIQS